MKKCLAMILAVALAFSMSTVAFAARDNEGKGKGDEEMPVTIAVDKNDNAVTYFVVITWGTLAFAYQEADSGSWNVETHSYTGTKEEGWVTGVDTVADKVTSTITVENHSNAAVSFEYKFETASAKIIPDDDGVAANLEATKTDLASAAEGGYLGAEDTDIDGYADGDKATVTLTVSGTPGAKWNESAQTLDTIVITVS